MIAMESMLSQSEAMRKPIVPSPTKERHKGDEDGIEAFAPAVFARIEDEDIALPDVIDQADVNDFVFAEALGKIREIK